MKLENFNKVLKQARLDANMTQKELAEGVCTQAQISKLERGDEFPSSITLYLISKKLGVDAEYFFRQIESDRVEYIDDVKNIVRKYKRDKNYQKINNLVRSQLNTPLAKENKDFYQFLLWHLGICAFYLEDDKHKALKFLTRSLSMRDRVLDKEREVAILNSIAIILNEKENYQFSLKVFDRALEKVKKLPIIKDFTIEIRLLFGASKSALNLWKINQALDYSQKGINICKQYETFYLLGELYYQKARCLKRINDEESAVFFRKSIQTFLLEDKKEYAEVVEKAYVKYINKLKKGRKEGLK
ncbi:XRE family transcriptional regulator [Filobacillus milosensis]|uniref:XRE family transcriptional regulator n=1 Tax=Filobacillus milosensis TaxID=94137 RepID=A0A4Y8IT88_9BACI|nr:helix-turn-helix domain-containing protein [Filobacillus milosensis]TFB25120.1 XRE family transcriptional regulator [Filobacillus milosensis]